MRIFWALFLLGLTSMAGQAPAAAAVPPANLDYGSLDWETVDGALQTSVPASWVDNFVIGEQERNNGTAFSITTNNTKGKPNVGRGPYKQTVWWCQRGPEDLTPKGVRDAAAACQAVKTEAHASGGADSKPRASRVAKGLSIKVGCKCHFTVKVYDSSPGMALIRYNDPEHANHESRFAPFISDETKLWVRLMLLASDDKISTSKLKTMNENRYLSPIMCGNCFCMRPYRHACRAQSAPERVLLVRRAVVSAVRRRHCRRILLVRPVRSKPLKSMSVRLCTYCVFAQG